jgi:3-isopropylmalate/(R)-2-methylmalate dehydratase small subunit
MTPFTTLTAVAVPIDIANVDTDQIIPARYLGRPRQAQAEGLFHDLRFDAEGRPRTDFPLDRPAYTGARILVADRNFGCGSSRENAVTVMVDHGFRAFVAPSFGDIFHNNCFQNGALPIRLPAARVDALRAALRTTPGASIAIDLVDQTVTGPDGEVDRFDIDPFRKDCLLRGVDEISMTLGHADEIARYEARRREEEPWVFGATGGR